LRTDCGHCLPSGAPDDDPDRPNIIFIVDDDCGYADFDCTGQTGYRTPALDRLAAEGARFTQAYANAPLCTNTRVAMITGRYQYRLKRAGYVTDLLSERALAYIEAAAAAPYFLSLHYNAPHWPWSAPSVEAAAREREVDRAEIMEGGSPRIYGEMMQVLDAGIGRVVAAVRRSGRDTLVIFTSDNGGERYSNIWPFVGRKWDLLEGGLRVPQIVWWPRRIKAGQVTDHEMLW
jgi:arylsulfatase A-like enzyme